MDGVQFKVSDDGKQVFLHLDLTGTETLSVTELRNRFMITEFRDYCLYEEALEKAIAERQDNQKLAGPAEEVTVALMVAEQIPAQVEVEIADEAMTCRLKVTTAFGCDNPDQDQLSLMLAEHGVIEGVDDHLLAGFSKQMNNAPAGSHHEQIVARGKLAQESSDAQLEYLVEPIQDRLMQPKIKDDGNVDMYDFGEIEVVEIGDVLIRRIPPRQGAAGYTVLGNAVAADNPKDVALEADEGTQLSDQDSNLLVASRRGVAVRTASGMIVEDAYCVNDVDLKTGNVEFDGTVVVRGSVKDGMQVKASGDVMVQDFVESASIECGGNLIVGKGVLGRQLGKEEQAGHSVNIQCNGNFHANYVQYARLLVEGDVRVEKHVMHSDMTARNIYVEGTRRNEGKLIGGTVRPLQLFQCNVLGGPSYIPTRVDFSTRFAEQLAELDQVNEELMYRIRVVKGMGDALKELPKNSNDAAVKDQTKKIENTINHFTAIIVELKAKKNQLLNDIEVIKEQLDVVVLQRLFPGVSINYVDKPVAIRTERDSCRIKSKASGITFFTLS